MLPRASRLLHVLPLAPAASAAVVWLAPAARAEGEPAPAPYVVTLDAGHGGKPDDSRPDLPYDPGAIGVNGLLEKDLTLDIARRARALLQADDVAVAMTRDDDRFVPIESRTKTAVDSHSSLFVSIHLNSYSDPSVGGSLVLYPGQASIGFAREMEGALGRGLAPYGVEDDGVQLRDNWWIHVPMPVATVEAAYLTNPHDASLLARPSFRQALAGAVRDGVEGYDPAVSRRREAIATWNAAHPSRPVDVRGLGSRPSPPEGSSGSWLPGSGRLALAVAVAAVVVAQRRTLALALSRAGGAAAHPLAASLRRRAARPLHRRRRQLRRAAAAARPVRRHRSVYDELGL